MATQTTTAPPPQESAGRARALKLSLICAAFVVVYGTAIYLGKRAGNFLMEGQPSANVTALQDHEFALASKVLASDGQLIYSFAAEKRDYVSYDEISPWLIQGLIATEDEQFWDHHGLNYKGIGRAAINDAKASYAAGRLTFPQGGSSITQQLAKMLFLSPEKKIERKLKEAVLALQIEKNFNKEEILEMYLNQVYLGNRRYGVEAASRYYFGSSARDLTLPEAALIAGLPQRPSAYAPRSHPEAALKRRDHVISRMETVGYITPEEAAEARSTPLELHANESERRMRTQQAAPFFIEDIRKQLVADLGDAVNTGGLEIETTLDMTMQRAATRAIRDGLRKLDKRVHGFSPIETNVLDEGLEPETYEHASWLVEPEVDGVIPGVVLEVSEESALVRIGEEQHRLDRSSIAWTKKKSLPAVLRRGDIAPFKVLRHEEGHEDEGAVSSVLLEQHPPFEAALVAIDVASGEILAMVGGYDYTDSQFNKASQARRQAGSAFKPLYYALAMEVGLSPGTSVIDEPTNFLDPWSGEEYTPENYRKDYHGKVTLRYALEKSLNIASVRLLNYLGYDETIDFARKCGITANLRPYPSLALGASEVSLLEITSSYTVFPNLGLRVEPTLIRSVRDAKGNVLLGGPPRVEEVLSPTAAFQTVQLLRGVVENGTGKKAKKLNRPVAGKTGTTDDYSDAWFVGFTPSLAIGVWVGYEKDKERLCKTCSGGTTALPIWMDFVDEILEGKPVEQFVNPGGIEFVAVDRRTGLRASQACSRDDVFLEALSRDARPPVSCSQAHHDQLLLPTCLQRHELDVNGVLIVEDEDALMQLEEEFSDCAIFVDPVRRVIELPGRAYTGQGSLPYRPAREVYRPGLRAPSIEDLMLLDPRALKSRDLSGLRDFDVFDGRTVVVSRNEGSRYR